MPRKRDPKPLTRLAKLLRARPYQLGAQALKRAAPERFFARVRCFDLSCPRCGRIATTSPHYDPAGKPNRGGGSAFGWNPVACRFRCPACRLELVIGLVAWVQPGKLPTAPAGDSQPHPGEALRLREGRSDWEAEGAKQLGVLVRPAGRAPGTPLAGGGKEFANLVVGVEPEPEE